MRKFFAYMFLIGILTISSLKAQVLTYFNPTNALGGQNAFIDASTNFDSSIGSNILGKGLIYPRTDLTQWSFVTDMLDGIFMPTYFDGMIVFNTGTGNTPTTGNNPTASTYVTPGFYYFSNPGLVTDYKTGQWKPIGGGATTLGWNVGGNAGTTAGTNFIGTTDDVDIIFKRNNVLAGLLNVNLLSTSFGVNSLANNVAMANTALGYESLYSNSTGQSNLAAGYDALYSNVDGNQNAAIGNNSLTSNTNGSFNVAVGESSLLLNTSGSNNIALGVQALQSNVSGNYNIALGNMALFSNIGNDNAAIGASSLFSNIDGENNTSVGVRSLYSSSNGNYDNTAVGYQALYNSNNSSNTAVGSQALFSNISGANNTVLGFQALYANDKSENIAIGTDAGHYAAGGSDLTSVENSIFIGNNAVAAANDDNNEIVIGNQATGNGSNTVTLGNENITATLLKGRIGVGTSSPVSSAMLEVSATDKGILFPRVALTGTTDVSTITSPAAYLTVFNTASTNDVTPGYYYWTVTTGGSKIAAGFKVAIGGGGVGGKWVRLLTQSDVATNAWGLSGNTGTTPGTNFIGTTDNTDIVFKRNYTLAGLLNSSLLSTAFGVSALQNNASGTANTSVGAYGLYSNFYGEYNTVLGYNALAANQNSSENIAIGTDAGHYDSTNSNLSTIDNSIFIGNNTVAAGNGDSNEIVIGDQTIGNGSNTVTLGNDAIAATLLKGSVGVGGVPSSSAVLDLKATNKGVLFPRVALTGVSDSYTIANPAPFLTVFNTSTTADVKPGYYYWDGSSTWIAVAGNTSTGSSTGGSGWELTGNSGTNAAVNFIGTKDDVDVVFKQNGFPAGLLNNSMGNTSFGVHSFANFTGNYNTAVGSYALAANTSGKDNTCLGYGVLDLNTTGTYNTAVGSQCLVGNTTGGYNTALGYAALHDNIIGSLNTALGFSALRNNKNSNNLAVGNFALFTNVTGSSNTAVGNGALYYNLMSNNTAFGYNALNANTQGGNNTGLGYQALYLNTLGSLNTAVGHMALGSNVSGNYNTAFGTSADENKVSGDNCIAIGSNASTGANSNYVQIGDANITSIGGQVSWTARSDKRIKQNFKENVPGLDFITKLKPISYTFNFEKQDEITGAKADTSVVGRENRKRAEAIIHTGFAAQDVEAVLKSLNYDFDGVVKPQNDKDLYSISYSLFTVPLVKAVQEQQKQIQQQKQQIEELQKLVNGLLKKQ